MHEFTQFFKKVVLFDGIKIYRDGEILAVPMFKRLWDSANLVYSGIIIKRANEINDAGIYLTPNQIPDMRIFINNDSELAKMLTRAQLPHDFRPLSQAHP